MRKYRLHFYSDCRFFGGSENMLANFFNDEKMHQKYEISFSYRYTKAYEQGLNIRLVRDITKFSLPLIDVYEFNAKIKIRLLRWLLFPCRYLFVFINTLKLFFLFKRLNIDILHINNGGYPGAYSCMSAVFAARMCGVKNIIYVVNNIAFPYTALARKLDYFFDTFVAKYVNVFITGSMYAGKQLQKVLRLGDDKIITIHNGISPRRIDETREEMLKRLNLDAKNNILIGVVALMEKRKGHIFLIKAFELFLKELGDKDDIPFLLLEGTGIEYEFLKKYVSSHGLEKYIYFIGNEKNIFNFINNIDILVLPSIAQEDFPNVVLEAMSCKKAVVSSIIAGTPEQIDHMQNGVLVEPMDINGLKNSIKLFYENRNLITEFGENALIKFNKNFSKDIAIARYIDLYSKFIEE